MSKQWIRKRFERVFYSGEVGRRIEIHLTQTLGTYIEEDLVK